MEIETITTITVSAVAILTAIVKLFHVVWKSRKRGYETRAEEMQIQLEKSVNKTEANLKEIISGQTDRFEKNILNLFKLTRDLLVSNTELKSDMKHIKAHLELK